MISFARIFAGGRLLTRLSRSRFVGSKPKHLPEETEQLDEIGDTKQGQFYLRHYVKAAGEDLTQRGYGRYNLNKRQEAKANKTDQKRLTGIKGAAKRINNKHFNRIK